FCWPVRRSPWPSAAGAEEAGVAHALTRAEARAADTPAGECVTADALTPVEARGADTLVGEAPIADALTRAGAIPSVEAAASRVAADTSADADLAMAASTRV